MSNNVTILAGLGMVCGTILGGLYITHKDNKKMIEKVYEPINKMVDVMEKYVDHTIKEDEMISKTE